MANIICHAIKADAKFGQTWLTSGCPDDRGNVDETNIGDLCEYHVM
jgi:hypothetical protein